MPNFKRLSGVFRKHQEPRGLHDAVPQPREKCGLFLLADTVVTFQAVDIVAVHGLGGDWESTWTAEGDAMWLRDSIPSVLEEESIGVRVFSYGYDASTAFSKSVADITDEAAILLDRIYGQRKTDEQKKRPIVFVAHSLGGILVKKAMILAHERSSVYGSLLVKVRSVMFLGTPHRGSDAAYWAKFGANLTEALQLGFGSNKSFVEALQTYSTEFANISQQWVDRAVSLKIRTFYELERTHGILVVRQESARLDLPNEIAVGAAGVNHKQICKFADFRSQRYEPIRNAMEELAQYAVADLVDGEFEEQKKRLDTLFRSLYFQSMDDRVEDIESAHRKTFIWLLNPQSSIPPEKSLLREWLRAHSRHNPIFWLSGKAGSGKSTLMKYLHENPKLDESLLAWKSCEQLKGLVIAGAYFYERGVSELQKSRAGLLRILLYQILSQEPLYKPLVLESKLKSMDWEEDRSPTRVNWNWRDLKVAFTKFLSTKPDDVGLYIFADGLDEYNSDELLSGRAIRDGSDDRGEFVAKKRRGHKELVELFSGLARYPTTKICLSSRPLPVFSEAFEHFPHLNLEDLTRNDIQRYVGDRLKTSPVPHQLLTKRIVDRAMGVFLWVRLVVDMLLDGIADGDHMEELEATIEDTPEELGGPSGLYMTMLNNIASTNLGQGYQLFEVIRHARHVVSPLMLSFSEDKPVTAVDPSLRKLSETQMRSRIEGMKRRLKSRCAGLLEIQTISKGRSRELASPLSWITFDSEGNPASSEDSGTESDSHSQQWGGNTISSVAGDRMTIVGFFHQTVKEFLQDRAVQQEFLKSGHKIPDVNVILLRTCILRLKYIGVQSDAEDEELWGAIKDAIYYAGKAERSMGEAQTSLLDEFDRTVSEMFKVSPAPHSVGTKWPIAWKDYVQGRYHWSILEPRGVFGNRYGWRDNFLSLATQGNLRLYLEEKLSASEHRPKLGRPLLAYATAPVPVYRKQQSSDLFKDTLGCRQSDPATVSVLLRHGENPNLLYHGRTVWQHMFQSLLETSDNGHGPFFDQPLTIARMMLEAAADPNAPVIYPNPGYPRSWRYRSCLYAIIDLLNCAKKDQLEVAQQLFAHGGRIFSRERSKLPQWIRPHAKLWLERQDVSNADCARAMGALQRAEDELFAAEDFMSQDSEARFLVQASQLTDTFDVL